MGIVIDTTPDYVLTIGDVDGQEVYVIKNIHYGIVEANTALLPQALEYLGQIQAALDVRRAELEDGVAASTDGVLEDK